jgi:hypothetical protein
VEVECGDGLARRLLPVSLFRFAPLFKVVEKFFGRIGSFVRLPTAATGAGDLAITILFKRNWQVALWATGHPPLEGTLTPSVLNSLPEIDFLGVLVFQPVQFILQLTIFILQFRYRL